MAIRRRVYKNLKKYITKRSALVGAGGAFIFSFTFAIATDQRIHHFHLNCDQYAQNCEWINQYLAKYQSLAAIKEDTSCFNRCVMALHAAEVILNGKYEDFLEFVCHQPEEVRLKWHSFQNLQNHMRGVLRSVEGIDEACVRALVDHVIISERTELAQDHLTKAQKELLVTLKAVPNLNKVLHLEGGPGIFSPLKQSTILNQNPIAFEIGFFVYLCNVAASMGHIDQRSTIALNENTYRAITAVKKSCLLLREESETEAYRSYLSQRAAWLGLDPDSPLHQVLARIGSMMALFTPEDGRALKEAFLKLPPEAMSEIMEELGGLKLSLDALCPVSVPALLGNLMNNYSLGSASKDRLNKAIHIGLPFVARVLKEKKRESVEIDFSQAAQIAKDRPDRLSELKYTLSKEGLVTLD